MNLLKPWNREMWPGWWTWSLLGNERIETWTSNKLWESYQKQARAHWQAYSIVMECIIIYLLYVSTESSSSILLSGQELWHFGLLEEYTDHSAVCSGNNFGLHFEDKINKCGLLECCSWHRFYGCNIGPCSLSIWTGLLDRWETTCVCWILTILGLWNQQGED